MTTIYQFFSYSAFWNTVESISYQSILVLHQYALYQILPKNIYSSISICFSLIYLGISVCNFGLDNCIGPFFWHISETQSNALLFFKRLLLNHLYILLIISIVSIPCMYYFLRSDITISMLIIMAFLFIAESIKKTMRILLHCALINRRTTYIELTALLSYVFIIWMLYYHNYTLNNIAIFVPMTLISWISLLGLGYVMYEWYKQLPISHISSPAKVHTEIAHYRMQSYTTQLSRIAFSSNFLIPLFAWHCGIEYVGILKLVSYVSYFIYTVMYKIFGEALQSCLALWHTINTHEEQKDFFNTINHYMYSLLSGTIFIIYILAQYFNMLDTIKTIGCLFFLCMFIENFIISYEKMYQHIKKNLYITLFNFINLIVFTSLTATPLIQTPFSFLTTFLLLRISTIIGIVLTGYYFWHIKPVNITYATTMIKLITAAGLLIFFYYQF